MSTLARWSVARRLGAALLAGGMFVVAVPSADAALTTPSCLAKKLKEWGKLRKCQAVENGKALQLKLADLAKCQTKFDVKLAKLTEMATAGGIGCRYGDNNDGTVTDYDTGLVWEQKTGDVDDDATYCDVPTCPGGNWFKGSYSTSIPSTGSFEFVVASDGTTWAGWGWDSVLGSIDDFGGTVGGTTLSGTGYSGLVTVSGTITCGTATASGAFGGTATGSWSGLATLGHCPDPHRVNNWYGWTVSPGSEPYPPDGSAFTNFLGKLNGGASPDAVTISGCFAGHCDWRLPSIAELQTLLVEPFPCSTIPCIDPIFEPTAADMYWSATPYAGYPDAAWCVDFFDGQRAGGYKDNVQPVRAVRSGL